MSATTEPLTVCAAVELRARVAASPVWLSDFGAGPSPSVIDDDPCLFEAEDGSILVRAGHLVLEGELRGTLDLAPMVRVTLRGTHVGLTWVDSCSTLTITGTSTGPLDIAPAGTLVVELGGRMTGRVHNRGEIIVRGIFAGELSGPGRIAFEGEGQREELDNR